MKRLLSVSKSDVFESLILSSSCIRQRQFILQSPPIILIMYVINCLPFQFFFFFFFFLHFKDKEDKKGLKNFHSFYV